MDLKFLASDRVEALVSHLMHQKAVYAPQRMGRHSVALDKVTNPAAVVLDYSRTMQSVKKYFQPPRDELLKFDLTDQSFAAATVEPLDAVLLGIHSYDRAASDRLDYNFSQGQPEKNYLKRREGVVWVGVSYEPDEFHFSGSVGIGPLETEGFDVFLSRVGGGYQVETVTEKGGEILAGFDLPQAEQGKPSPGHFHQHIFLPQARLNEVMAASYSSPVWEETAQKCVGCGSCNIVCPTCYCFNVEENVDIKVTGGTRERIWDGCMLREFTEVAGGEVFRGGLAERQRHRVLRKFKYLSDRTGHPWCVGCGRCTAYCTAGISIVSIVHRCVSDFEKHPTTAV